MPIDQMLINKKIKKYLELTRTDASSKNKEIELLTKSFEEGRYCSGLSGLYLYRKKRDQESVFLGILRLISEWDEKVESLKAGNSFLENIFERMINDMQWAQIRSAELQSIKYKNLADIFEVVKKTPKSNSLALEFTMSFVYKNANEITQLLENVVSKNPNKLIYIFGRNPSGYSDGHAIAIMCKEEIIDNKVTYNYYLYNPSSPEGEIVTSDLKELQENIKLHIFQLMRYDTHLLPISISIFDEADQAKYNYKKSSIELAGTLLQENESLERVAHCLIFAVLEDDLDLVRYIITNTKIKINNKAIKDSIPALEAFMPQSLLTIASAGSSENTLNYLLSEQSPLAIHINQQDALGKTALSHAAQGNLRCVISLLKQQDINPNIKDIQGKAPLHLAIEKDRLDIAKELTNNLKTDINLKDSDGNTALMIAIKNKNVDIIRVLLNRADILLNSYNNENAGKNQNLLMMAIETGSKEIVKLILEKVPALQYNEKDRYGETPLFYAIRSGDPAIIKMVLSKLSSKDLNIKNKEGYTPSMIAIRSILLAKPDSNIDYFIDFLNNKDVDLSLTFPNGDTLYTAALMTENPIIEKAIVDAYKKRKLLTPEFEESIKEEQEKIKNTPKPKPVEYFKSTLISHKGITPLHIATIKNRLSIVKRLTADVNTDINSRDNAGNTALMIATSNVNVDIVRILLDRTDILLNTFNEQNQNLLMMALETGNKEIIKLILEKISDNQYYETNQAGESALFYAMRTSDPEIINMVLSKTLFSSLNIKNNEGYTPLMVYIRSLLFMKEDSKIEYLIELLNNKDVDLNITFPNGDTLYSAALMTENPTIAKVIVDAYKNRDIFTAEIEESFKQEQERIENMLKPEPFDYLFMKTIVPQAAMADLSMSENLDLTSYLKSTHLTSHYNADLTSYSISSVESIDLASSPQSQPLTKQKPQEEQNNLAKNSNDKEKTREARETDKTFIPGFSSLKRSGTPSSTDNIDEAQKTGRITTQPKK